MYLKHILLFLTITLIAAPISAQLFVAPQATGEGSAWDNPTSLHQALQNATEGDEIWVQSGNYFPILCNPCTTTDREIYLEIPDGVAIFGGFSGSETTISQRDWQNNVTIINGDIDQDGTLSNNSYTLIYTKNVTENTILDGFILKNANAESLILGHGAIENSGAAWYNDGSADSLGSHPTIRNCIIEDNQGRGFGAAIYNRGNLEGSASPTITNCIFRNNYSEAGGGAIYNQGSVDGESSPKISDCIFENNSTLFDGGAIENAGIENGHSCPTITNCIFENNSADKHGGAIHNFGKNGNSSPQILNCQFTNNYSDIGGAVYSDGSFSGQSHPEIRDSDFIGNTCQSAGAAIYNLGSEGGNNNAILYNLRIQENHSFGSGSGIFNNAINGSCNPEITNCIILKNTTDSYGAGIYNLGKNGICSPKITNCLIAKNKAASSAGGMYNLGSEGGNSSPTVTNCTFYGNEAIVGGGIYCNGTDATGTSQPLIRNSIIYGNSADFGPVFRCIFGSPIIQHCVVDKPDCASLNSGEASNVNCGPGVLYETDPLFMDVENDDFHLMPISNLVDMGSNMAINETGLLIDLDSTLRINNGTVDIGAYEYNAIEYLSPSFLTQPTSVSACEGENTQLEVLATGTPPLNFLWKKDGLIIPNSNTQILILEEVSLQNSGNYTCQVYGTLSDTVTSTVALVNINENVDASIQVQSSTNSICQGQLVEFTATTEFEGTNPQYDWIVNGMSTNVSTATFSSSDLQDGDVVGCIFNASAPCVQNNPVISNAVIMSVQEGDLVEVEILASTTSICAKETILFEVESVNEGTNPSYQWLINGQNVGENSPIFETDALEDGDEVSVILLSNADCVQAAEVESTPISIGVSSPATPEIHISSDIQEPCEGESITFISEVTNGGLTPTYQWQINGENVGLNNSIFETTELANGDILTCILESNQDCLTSNAVQSNAIEVQINEPLTPSVNINSSATDFCAGELVRFEASTNVGTLTTYQWKINAQNVGEDSPIFETDALEDGDIVDCEITTSEECLSVNNAVSNSIELQVSDQVLPSIQIEANSLEICTGEEIIFSAIDSNGGNNPMYQWRVNDEIVGSNSATFTSNNLSDGDIVSCTLTSNSECVSQSETNSNNLTINILPLQNPTIVIEVNNETSCSGEELTFMANTTLAGDEPMYMWYVNNNLVTTNTSPSFSVSGLNNEDVVACTLISSATCLQNTSINSNDISLNILPNLEPQVELIAPLNTICAGQMIAISADVMNEGENPNYTWYVNGDSVSNQVIFETTTLNNQDEIWVQVTSSAACVENPIVVSETFAVSIQNPVNPSISIDLESTNELICEGDSLLFFASTINEGVNPQYQWFINDEPTENNGLTFESQSLQDGDIITCQMQVEETCVTKNEVLSNTVEIAFDPDCINNLSELENNYPIHISPNPSEGMIQIRLENYTADFNISIYNLNGQLLRQQAVAETQNRLGIDLDLSNFTNGTYLVRISNQELNQIRRIVLQK